MFVITSAGDNALHYAIEANPKQVGIHTYILRTFLNREQIHCVDMNPW
jgi:hypothetical protein